MIRYEEKIVFRKEQKIRRSAENTAFTEVLAT